MAHAEAWAAGPPVFIDEAGPVDRAQMRVVRDTIARFRSVAEPVSLPTPGAVSPEIAAADQRAQAIRLALGRARKKEGEALWDDCVKEVTSAMGDAIEVIAGTGEMTLLRDLHTQAGACMSLAGEAAGARLHFWAATLLDETPPPTGLHRQEAEQAQVDARREILARPSGKVRVVTDPAGARVVVDGREIAGTTPLDLDARLGDHFVTVRRFRFETNTEQRLLQPSAVVRINLEPARRSTLGEQLAAVRAGMRGGDAPSPDELRLAAATWSRAEQVFAVSTDDKTATYRLTLIDAPSGRVLRAATAARGATDAALRTSVCGALGEICEPQRGIPWYVWPLAGAVLVAGAVTTAIVLNNNRDTRFCPPSGCK
jgi:hypothetical protein